ncbi:hypothetical protein NEMIN01_0903 [Nematocida minor]|uniref:uncharacterized protein n=1 Tax=Nematocida minor TaxID=1912983 RepID=UPI00221EEFE9|nr:uncharacterized protein NEMIN01_0903 [Nematocida minor]KAI5190204.1 hypothetical protein NEMIN01_0903 [Nematocida minor]
MEYVLKVSSKQELLGKVVFVDEHLGARADPFMLEIFREFPQHQLISYHRMLSEYSTKKGISLLETNAASIEVEPETEVLIIDGWKHRSNTISKNEVTIVDQKNKEIGQIERKNKIIFIINRSITQTDYREIYKAYVLVRLQPLAISTMHTHSTAITIREKDIEVRLLHHHTSPHKYTVHQ